LAYELRRTGTDRESFDRFTQSNPEWSTHPVGNKPFVLNDTRTAVFVQPLGSRIPGRRFDARLIYAQPPTERLPPTRVQ
jgi:hypothetical protein